MLSLTTPNFVAIDTETTGLNLWQNDEVFTASAAFPSGRILFWRNSFEGLREILEDSTIDKVFQNAKFDWRGLEKLFPGLKIRGRVWDTMIFAHLMDGRSAQRKQLNLDYLSARYLPPSRRKVIQELDDWFAEHKVAKKDQGKHFTDLPPELLNKRCNSDAILTCLLFMKLYPVVVKEFALLLEQEHRLLPIVKRMEDRGLVVDPDEVIKQSIFFDEVIEDVTGFCEDILGWEGFNINSHDHQSAVLERTGILHLITKLTTKTKKKQIKERTLRDLHHPVAHMLLLGKKASDLNGKFLQQMQRFYHYTERGPIVHPHWNQVGTLSGRFSTSKPNLLNIPAEGGHLSEEEIEEAIDMTGIDFAPHIKRCFLCSPGYAHIHSDKEKVEVYMLAHYTKDPVMLEIMKSGLDIHEEISLRMFNSADKRLRVRAKAVVFGYIYGAGDGVIASNCRCSIPEAKEYRARLSHVCTGLERWKKELQRQLANLNYIVTDHGRRHYLLSSESYMAINRMCQGTAADEVKSRMVDIGEWFERDYPDCSIILNYHDDVGSEVPIELLEEVAPKYHELMEDTKIKYELPLPASLEATDTRWADLKDYEEYQNDRSKRAT